MSSSVLVKEAVLITPSEPTPIQILPLSALDSQLFLRFTIEYLLVYKPSRHVLDKSATVNRIKAALGRALIPYYPLAGRVRARTNGSGLEVVCRAQGATFLQAASDLTSKEFEGAPRHKTQWRKLLSLQVADVLNGAPPLVVQLTWLSDGSATLGVGFNHCICDGIGSAQFLNLLAELATTCNTQKFTAQPIWDRFLMDPKPYTKLYQQKTTINHPEFKKVPDVCGFVSRFSQERLAPTSVTFDKRRVNELKKLTYSQSLYTSFEVLSAHIWKSWATSLKLPPNQTLKLLFTVNIRNRVKPSLPSGYYGNGFVLGCAQASAKDLVERGLGYASGLIKRAKERVDDEYVRQVVESVSSSGTSPDSVGVLIMSQWSRLGLEKVDIGMGRPVEVGPVCCDRYCILLPVYDQKDSVKVNVAVPASAVDKYLYLLKSIGT
ncbi:alcohol acyltransferase 9 [Lycium ferocissimum]|uniref:alcohol acyltransferase 9 n=1 Tax=Lycium ferocissimum TaxID=112874 RepID=UPI002814BD6F|nr:alcohol acyltransferase 9 [Lycium ferocissimum]